MRIALEPTDFRTPHLPTLPPAPNHLNSPSLCLSSAPHPSPRSPRPIACTETIVPQATSHTHIHTYMLASYAEPNVPGTSYSSTYKHIHATSQSRLHVPRQMYLKLQATYTHVNATSNAEPWSSSTSQARRTHHSSQGSSAVEVECRDHGSLLANRVLYGRACLDNPPCDKMALVPKPAGCGRRLSGARALASVAAYGR